MSDYEEESHPSPPASSQLPPPASQSHFAQFDNFIPNEDASFDHEFSRLAASQDWIIGSQQYTKERTIAMREELKLLYFSQSQDATNVGDLPTELTEEQKLGGFQDLCDEVGIAPSDSIDECKRNLKSTLVNIVDLINARRTSSVVKVWHDFDAFREYTLQDGHRIDKHEAKKDGGFLASLLQNLSLRRRRRRKGNNVIGNAARFKVATGRVAKMKRP